MFLDIIRLHMHQGGNIMINEKMMVRIVKETKSAESPGAYLNHFFLILLQEMLGVLSKLS